MLQRAYSLAPFVPNLFGFSYWFSKKLSKYNFFRLVVFWKEHEGEFEFKNGYATLKEYNLTYKTSQAYDFFKRYYQMKSEQKIYTDNGKLCAKIEDYAFQINTVDALLTLEEIFVEKCYKHFNLKNKTVLDIGGFIADSAIFFIHDGATKVIMFEPNPVTYQVAKQNIEYNNLLHRIQPVQQAVSTKQGTQLINVKTDHPGKTSLTRTMQNSTAIEVKTTTLKNILEKYGPIDVLKLDCEGAEHQILPQAQEQGILDGINEIMVEIHGDPAPTLGALRKANFEITKQQQLNKNLLLLFAKKR